MEAEAAVFAPVEEQEPMEVEENKADGAADEPAPPADPEEAVAEEEGKVEEAAAEKKTPAAKKAGANPKPTPASAEGTGTGGRVRRERKQVERFVPAVAPKEEEPQAVPEGKGTKLRDIPNINFKMGKMTGKDELMEGLHNVLFRRKGTAQQRKKGILDFNGFAFPEDQQEKELAARNASLSKWKLELVHKLMDTLDLPRGSGDKAAKVDRILEFLTEPRATSDVDLAAKVADKKAKEKARKERAAAKKEKEAAKKGKEKAKKEKAAAAKRKSTGSAARPAKKAKKEGEEHGESEPEEEEPSASEPEEEEGSEEEGSDFEAELKKKEKKGGSSGARQRKAAAAEEGEEGGEAMEEDGKEQDEASKVSAEDLKKEVEAVLAAMEGSELPGVTAKPILKKLEAKHGFNFKSRKGEVKDLARDYVVKFLEEHPELQPATEEEAKKEEVVPSAEATEEAALVAKATEGEVAAEAGQEKEEAAAEGGAEQQQEAEPAVDGDGEGKQEEAGEAQEVAASKEEQHGE